MVFEIQTWRGRGGLKMSPRGFIFWPRLGGHFLAPFGGSFSGPVRGVIFWPRFGGQKMIPWGGSFSDPLFWASLAPPNLGIHIFLEQFSAQVSGPFFGPRSCNLICGTEKWTRKLGQNLLAKNTIGRSPRDPFLTLSGILFQHLGGSFASPVGSHVPTLGKSVSNPSASHSPAPSGAMFQSLGG